MNKNTCLALHSLRTFGVSNKFVRLGLQNKFMEKKLTGKGKTCPLPVL
jgi:hypothetical protein